MLSLDESIVRNQLEAGQNPDLTFMCCSKQTDLIQDFRLWLEVSHFIDNKRHCNIKLKKHLLEEAFWKCKKQCIAGASNGKQDPLANTTNIVGFVALPVLKGE